MEHWNQTGLSLDDDDDNDKDILLYHCWFSRWLFPDGTAVSQIPTPNCKEIVDSSSITTTTAIAPISTRLPRENDRQDVSFNPSPIASSGPAMTDLDKILRLNQRKLELLNQGMVSGNGNDLNNQDDLDMFIHELQNINSRPSTASKRYRWYHYIYFCWFIRHHVHGCDDYSPRADLTQKPKESQSNNNINNVEKRSLLARSGSFTISSVHNATGYQAWDNQPSKNKQKDQGHHNNNNNNNNDIPSNDSDSDLDAFSEYGL